MTAKPSASFLLANLVMDARDLHQRSYDWAQSLADIEKTQSEKAAAVLANPGDPMAGVYINHSRAEGYHTMTLHDACVKVCADLEPELAEPVYYLLIGAWNESGDWASKLSGREDKKCDEFIQWEKDMNAIYDKYDTTKKEVTA